MPLDVTTVINDARTYASDSFEAASSLIEDAQSSARGRTSISTSVSMPSVNLRPDINPAEVPTFSIGIDLPTEKPILDAFPPVHIPVFPSLPDAPDGIDLDELFQQTPPEFNVPPLTAVPPPVDDIDSPDAPVLNPIPSPILRPIPEVSDPPTLVLPEFSALPPSSPPTAPCNLRQTFEDTYRQYIPELRSYVDDQVTAFIARYYPDYDEMVDRVNARLIEMLDGKALPEEAEQALFDRARARVEQESLAAEKQVYEDAARRGFTVPTGMLVHATMQAAQARADRNATTALEVAIKQADLLQSNLQFAVNAALTMREGVRNAAIQYAGLLSQVNAQALEASQGVLRAIVDVYNAEVRQYESELSLFRIQGEIFELEIKAQLAQIQIFEAEVKLAELTGELNKIDVELVKAQIDVERSKVELYAEQMRAVLAQVEERKSRVDIFEAQVQAYATQVKAKEAEYGAYEAAIRGDEGKVRAHIAIFDAYKTEVDAAVARGGMEVSRQEADIKRDINIIEKYKAELGAYVTDVDVAKSKFDAEVRAFLGGIEGYKAKLQAQIAEAQAELGVEQLKVESQKVAQTLITERAIENARIFMQHVKIDTDAAIAGANAYASIAEAAVASQNSMIELAEATITNV